MHQMLFDDFVNVVLVNVAIPYRFGINYQHRPQLAAIKTTRNVDADTRLNLVAKLLDAILCIRSHSFRTVVIAAGLAVLALVGTEKYVMIKVAHAALSGAGYFCPFF